MGLFDDLMGKPPAGETASGKKTPFTVATSFRPMRLAARSDNSTDLLVDIHNISSDVMLCSVVSEVPKGLGFDGTGLHKTKEVRLGQIAAGEKKQVAFSLHGSSQTAPGTYRLSLTVYTHYRDYSHVLNSVSKTVELRVV